MCYPVYGMVHIKEPLLLIGKSSLCGGSGFPFSLSECSLTICLTPYNVLSASLNKTFPSFLLKQYLYIYIYICCCFEAVKIFWFFCVTFRVQS